MATPQTAAYPVTPPPSWKKGPVRPHGPPPQDRKRHPSHHQVQANGVLHSQLPVHLCHGPPVLLPQCVVQVILPAAPPADDQRPGVVGGQQRQQAAVDGAVKHGGGGREWLQGVGGKAKEGEGGGNGQRKTHEERRTCTRMLRGASEGEVGECAELGCYLPHSTWEPSTNRPLSLEVALVHALVVAHRLQVHCC